MQKRFNFDRAGALFNRKTLTRAFSRVVFDPTEEQKRAAHHWAAQVRHPNFIRAKEEEIRGQFIRTVLISILGYQPYRADGPFTLAEEETGPPSWRVSCF